MAIKLYACGGTGTAAASRVAKSMNTFTGGKNVLVADTSDSNINHGEFPDVFILPKLPNDYDGSGKLRSKNAEAIKKYVPKVLDQYPPEEYNIVISSGGGGSGSVFAPYIAQSIIDSGKICFIIITNNVGSLKAMDNTFNTHKSYISMNKGKCVPMFVVDNTDIKKADANVDYTISAIDTLVSTNNYGLDGSDILNFLRWDKVTEQSAGPAIITVVKDNIPAEIKDIISVLTLSTEMKEPCFSFVPEYTAAGVYDKDIINQDNFPDTHFVISKSAYAEMFNALQSGLEKEKKRVQNNRSASDSVELNFTADDDDSVL